MMRARWNTRRWAALLWVVDVVVAIVAVGTDAAKPIGILVGGQAYRGLRPHWRMYVLVEAPLQAATFFSWWLEPH